MMTDIKERGLDSPISQSVNTVPEKGKERYMKTVGFKVTEKQYETYRRYSKYFGIDELIKKWRDDLNMIADEKGKDMESVETEIIKHLNK